MTDHFKAKFSVVLPANRSDIFFFNTRVYNVRPVEGQGSEDEIASLWCAWIDRDSVALGQAGGTDLFD